jgi:hypothetical protein
MSIQRFKNGVGRAVLISAALLSITLLSITLLSVLFFSCRENADKDGSGVLERTQAPIAAGSSDGRLVEEGGVTYELHTFYYNPDTASNNQTEYILTFPAGFGNVSANVIVVAGGGGGGGTDSTDTGGGGGGGGVIQETSYTITGTVSVVVGGGGASGGRTAQGVTGTDSVFDSLTAHGGGGGGRGYNGSSNLNGLAGGSSGGAGAGSGTSSGTSPDPIDTIQGNKGGTGGRTSNTIDCGGGGGGAGGPGANGTGTASGQPGTGGDAREISGIPYHGNLSLSPGGRGGAYFRRALSMDDTVQSPSEYGGGGGAGTGGNSGMTAEIASGAPGNAGIVIVWWEYQPAP